MSSEVNETMELLFEKSVPGRGTQILPPCDVPDAEGVPAAHARTTPLPLPELSEPDVDRHYSALERRAHGVNNGFYPLGSCTMKYNPRLNEAAAGLAGFTGVHPTQTDETAQGCLKVLALAEEYLCEITGMDAMTFQPAAGAHGELCGVLLIKKYHEQRGDTARTKIIVPDSAHGTNPATAVMAGMQVVNIKSGPDGCVDLEALKAAAGPDTAGLMLTNPNTLGIFEKDILDITKIVHEAGGLVYYDGANLNAVMGVMRPGDMGFDCVHLNLHKTFSTPHGGGGPGSGAVGCKAFLAPYLPGPHVVREEGGANAQYRQNYAMPQSMGKLKGFYGNFLVVVRALCYIASLGRQGVPQAAQTAVLNANYLMHRLKEKYTIATEGICMHEFVLTLEKEAREHHVSAMDIAKALLDEGIHPPTMYFPLIVPEALMAEPTETESRETLDKAADVFLEIYDKAMADPAWAHGAPHKAPIGRPDEVAAARSPILRWTPAE